MGASRLKHDKCRVSRKAVGFALTDSKLTLGTDSDYLTLGDSTTRLKLRRNS